MLPAPARHLPAWLALTLATALLAGCVVAPPRHASRPGPPAPVSAPPMFFYPERGQSAERQDRDRYECYRLAVRDSGTDPGMTPLTRPWTPPPPQARRDGADVVGGAAAGAILGAAVSSPRQAGPNAVIGAVFGALLGAAVQESRAQAAEAAAAEHAAASARPRQPLADFHRAMRACMQARGYTVG
ncbi:MAG: glycine zipper 2TM domain-containing protein [Rubrivivax sp.]|jgi:hypothetical protein|nr:glycine zipper 2TM domain-containing protein [Rubrivivax sp.]